MEFILAVLGEICCQIVLAAIADTIVGVAGYKTYESANEPAKVLCQNRHRMRGLGHSGFYCRLGLC